MRAFTSTPTAGSGGLSLQTSSLGSSGTCLVTIKAIRIRAMPSPGKSRIGGISWRITSTVRTMMGTASLAKRFAPRLRPPAAWSAGCVGGRPGTGSSPQKGYAANNGTFTAGSGFGRRADLHVLDMWQRGNHATFPKMPPEHTGFCCGKGRCTTRSYSIAHSAGINTVPNARPGSNASHPPLQARPALSSP